MSDGGGSLSRRARRRRGAGPRRCATGRGRASARPGGSAPAAPAGRASRRRLSTRPRSRWRRRDGSA
jgi:hypothetical protein